MSKPSSITAERVHKGKLILIILCCIAIPVSFIVTRVEIGGVNKRVTRIESPCLRFGPKSRECRQAFEQAVRTITHSEACEILRKAGLTPDSCEKRKGGDALQPPHQAHQLPGPQSGGGSAEQGGAPTTQPEPPAEPAPEPHPIAETVSGLTETVTETACSVAPVAPVCTSPPSGG